jgi:hypothetical protein
MQICYYSGVKYYVGIQIPFLPFGDHLVGKLFFLFFLSIMGRFSTNFIVSCK